MSSERAQAASVQRLSWLLLLLGVVASVWLLRTARARITEPAAAARAELAELSEAVPEGPALLVTLDVSALGTETARKLMQAGGASLLGLQQLCGFEPLLAIRRVVLAMPPSAAGATADFALVAETTLQPEAVLRCAEAVIRKRGGSPARSRIGALESVRDRSKPLGEVAIRSDGLFVLSGGEYFRAVVDAASGARGNDEAARLRSAIHAKLRARLGAGQFVLSALPGAPWSLPGVQALGVALSFGADVGIHGVSYCATPAACEEAPGFLRELLREAAKDPRLSGVGQLQVVARGAELELSGRLPLEQLGPALSQLLAP